MPAVLKTGLTYCRGFVLDHSRGNMQRHELTFMLVPVPIKPLSF